MHRIPQAFNPPGEPIDRELPPPFVKIIGPQFTVHFNAWCVRLILDSRVVDVRIVYTDAIPRPKP